MGGYKRFRRRGLVLVVSDGAGSAKHSEVGARIVVDTALRTLSAQLGCEINPVTVLHSVRRALEDCAFSNGYSLRDLAATILAVAAVRHRREVHWTSLHVGDGVIAGDVGIGAEVISPPQNGEFGNSTFFVTETRALDHLRVNSGRCLRASFLLMTDGAAEPLYRRRDGRLAQAVDAMLSWPSQVSVRELQRGLSGNLRTVIAGHTFDDATIAVGVCEGI